jgi:hypothetical protein
MSHEPRRESTGDEERRGAGLELGNLRKVRFRDCAIRFAFGAAISVVAGVVALRFGHKIGGVFLAFPAILPASLTLVAHKESDHHASINAEGAVLGGIALVGFSLTAYLFLPRIGAWALLVAGAIWAMVAVALYFIARRWLASEDKVPHAPGDSGRRDTAAA